MAIAFENPEVSIPHGTGPRAISSSVEFNSTVRDAQIALNGFELDYTSNDHHLNTLEMDTRIVSIAGRKVFFEVPQ